MMTVPGARAQDRHVPGNTTQRSGWARTHADKDEQKCRPRHAVTIVGSRSQEAIITAHRERFQDSSARYAQFRPHYPDKLVQALAARIVAVQAPSTLPVLDIGSGTGIFTRQLAAYLPEETPLIGVEPASAMREQAVARTILKSVTYQDGTAEALPIENGAARAVLAATAAHWFERPAFYREARRALRTGGLLVIVEYVRDEKASAAAREVAAFLERHGERRAYTRPDYIAELTALEGFFRVEAVQQPVTLLLNATEFAGLALSSSHARQAIEKFGAAEADTMIRTIGAALANEDGKIPFGYLFQAFLAERTMNLR